MTIRAANNKTPGVHTYYVASESGNQYIVVHIRREGMNRWSCSCPDFLFRRQTRRSHRYCKHLKTVVAAVRLAYFMNRKKAA
jgi:predicted nucleic acid-binding Zn finger protein